MKIHTIYRNLALMILFGILSALLGMLKIQFPTATTTVTDLREIALIIGIYYISNPIYLVGMCIIGNMSVVDKDIFIATLIAHIITIFISSYVLKFILKKVKNIYLAGLFSFAYMYFYYIALLIPIMIFAYNVEHIKKIPFFNYYVTMSNNVKLETFATAVIIFLFLIQKQLRAKLIEHNSNLEKTVLERTSEINLKNNELSLAINNLKNTQSQLVQKEKMASLGILTAGVAHEINNPLNYINGGYYTLKDFFDNNAKLLNDDLNASLLFIKSGIEKAFEIVKSLNLFSHTSESIIEVCNINSIIDNCLVLLQFQYKDRIEIEKIYIKNNLNVTGNSSKLQQVVFNILLNSIQSIKKNGKITIYTSVVDNTIELQFIDTGIGIKGEDLTKVTDPFFTTKNPGEGTGLGLSIAYTIIKEHKGEIEFSSIENKGTTVKIMLPFVNE